MRHARSDAVESIHVPMRLVAADALALDAVGVVMAHNHPSGNPAPSADDLAVTRRLARTLEALGIRLFDHLVFAGGSVSSFRGLGLL